MKEQGQPGQAALARSATNDELLAALGSGEPAPVTATTWAESRARVAERVRAAAKKPRWTFDPNY